MKLELSNVENLSETKTWGISLSTKPGDLVLTAVPCFPLFTAGKQTKFKQLDA